jgi:antitoxin (DNA-binding transcriptional repressor) of toxin-antitoxin stability system
MKTASVASLGKNFRILSSWLDDGETVQITKRGRAYARLMPEVVSVPAKPAEKTMPEKEEPPVVWPDFAARRKAIWGDRVFSKEEVREMREYEYETWEQGL